MKILKILSALSMQLWQMLKKLWQKLKKLINLMLENSNPYSFGTKEQVRGGKPEQAKIAKRAKEVLKENMALKKSQRSLKSWTKQNRVQSLERNQALLEKDTCQKRL